MTLQAALAAILCFLAGAGVAFWILRKVLVHDRRSAYAEGFRSAGIRLKDASAWFSEYPLAHAVLQTFADQILFSGAIDAHQGRQAAYELTRRLQKDQDDWHQKYGRNFRKGAKS